jgi:hypothetical protein
LEIQRLNDWQIGLMYETVMNYPAAWLRTCYAEQKKSAVNFEDDDLLDMGYSVEEIAQMKGEK